MKVYRDPNDWWIGYYRGPNHHYVCPLPTVVIRWSRFRKALCGDVLGVDELETCYRKRGHEGSHESDMALWGEA
jgi:hypothetical protein